LSIDVSVSECTTPSPAGLAPSSRPAEPLWYAMYTRSNFEKRVAAELTALRVENYLPVVEQVHQWKDRKKVV
jgi:hypothetical protein